MTIVFANPLGFWALLSVPAVVAIYLFQRKARRVVIATSFLLDRLPQESLRGRRFAPWRHSWAFWWQLLGAILLSLLLAQPRWVADDLRQRVAIVVDESASMQAFREPALEAIRQATAGIDRVTGQVEWLLRGSRAETDRFFAGPERSDLLTSLEQWQPRSGAHDIQTALSAARLAVGTEGRVIYVSDHVPDQLPPDVELLAVGQPRDNVGIAGLRVRQGTSGPSWEAIVRNYGNTPAERTWRVVTTDQASPEATLTLPPGGASTLRGRFPEGTSQLSLELAPEDPLPLDDRAPLVIPQPRPLTFRLYGDAAFTVFSRRLLDLLPATSWDQGEGADLALAQSPAGRLRDLPSAFNEIHFGKARSDEDASLYHPAAVTERHALVDGLSFDGLVLPSNGRALFPVPTSATVLVWDGDEALVFLELTTQRRRLVFNFDVDASNLERLPAFVVLVQRFLEQVRRDKLAPWQDNFEPGQILPLPATADELSLRMGEAAAETISLPARAPSSPSFFELTHAGAPLLNGATQFLDTREADLRQAGAADDVSGINQAAIITHATDDPLLPLAVLALTGILLTGYHFAERNR